MIEKTEVGKNKISLSLSELEGIPMRQMLAGLTLQSVANRVKPVNPHQDTMMLYWLLRQTQ